MAPVPVLGERATVTKPEPVEQGRPEGTATFVPRPDSRDMEVIDEVWRDDVYDFHAEQVGFGGVVVDVGANIGAFTLLAAVGGARRTIAIEPDPANLEALRTNLSYNEAGLERVEVIEAGAWVKDTRGRVVAAAGSPDAVIAEDDLGGDIQLMTLDTIWREWGLLGCDLLKIDTEGAESAVIAGASDDLLWSVRRVVLEFHGPLMLEDRPGPEAESFGKMMARLGEFFRLEQVGRTSRGGIVTGMRY